MPETTRSPGDGREWFATTRWSLVLTAADATSGPGTAALEQLCRSYWYPLYAYVRRMGRSHQDAQDLVQGFFAACLHHGYLRSADRGKGRFRSFLLIALKRYLANQWDREQALKRGGDRTVISLDSLTAEQRYALEPVDRLTADQLYDRRWATTLLDQVLVRLREEETAAGRLERFEMLKEFLTAGSRGTPMADLAARLGTSEGALKVAAHRLRQRYRALLLEEIADTVASSQDVDAERRHLLAALGL